MLVDKINQTVHVLREVDAQFKKPCVLWSAGKDSTAMLNLIRGSFFGSIPWDVVHIDTGHKFPEMIKFRDELANDWGFNLLVTQNEARFDPDEHGHHNCCMNLKTKMLKQIINDQGYDAVIVSIRRDEHEIRNVERVTSPRDDLGNWRFVLDEAGKDAPIKSLSNVQLWDLIESDFGDNVNHVRIHPFLVRNYWSEIDVWNYIDKFDVPTNPLYFADNVDGRHRFRSLGCMPCTKPIKSRATTIQQIIDELIVLKAGERDGRNQDKEDNLKVMRYLGYM